MGCLRMHPGVAERGLLAWRLPALLCQRLGAGGPGAAQSAFQLPFPVSSQLCTARGREGSEHLATVHGGSWTEAQACSCCVLRKEYELLLTQFCMQIRINSVLGLIVNYLVC